MTPMRKTITRPRLDDGRLMSRPGTPSQSISPGHCRLGLDTARDGILVVPTSYSVGTPAPFVLSLYSAGGNEESGLFPLRELAESAGVILLSPASRRQTWDVMQGGFGPDIAFIDQALSVVFDRCAIDPDRLAVAGFSDGASYALSIGLANGVLFQHALAFSPGFMAPAEQRGSPRLFISHGTQDRVLPIDRCSRRMVPQLERAGYDLRYREFDGPHTIPSDITREALDWFTHVPTFPNDLSGRGTHVP
jgi:phospholipase/carboxylesterase